MPPDPPTPAPTEPPVFNCKGNDYAATVLRGSLILLQVPTIFSMLLLYRAWQANIKPRRVMPCVCSGYPAYF